MIAHNGYATDRRTLDAATLRTFYTSAGWLTPYALACGYIERAELAGGVSVTLWAEHGTIHVRAHDALRGRVFWDSFETVTAARARFTRAVRS